MSAFLRRSLVAALLAAGSLASSQAAHADSKASVIETQPPGEATLGRQQSFWVHIEYQTDEPISLWVRPYRNGAQVPAMSNASSSYVGSGEALGWFALTAPGEVDEVRILAGGGKPFREWELARLPVSLQWTDAAASGQSPAVWVTQLLEAEKIRYREDAQRRASEPVSAGSVAIAGGFMLAVALIFVAALGVPLWSLWKWRGGWRVAAAVPVAVLLWVVLRILVDTARDPASHNLWPFEILQFGIGALVIVGVLALARRVVGARAQ